jgi:hypothetical protein
MMNNEEALRYFSKNIGSIRNAAIFLVIGFPIFIITIYLIDVVLFKVPSNLDAIFLYPIFGFIIIAVYLHKVKKKIDTTLIQNEERSKTKRVRSFHFR